MKIVSPLGITHDLITVNEFDEFNKTYNENNAKIISDIHIIDSKLSYVRDETAYVKRFIVDNGDDILDTMDLVDVLYIRAARNPFIRFLNHFFHWFTLSLTYWDDEETDRLINNPNDNADLLKRRDMNYVTIYPCKQVNPTCESSYRAAKKTEDKDFKNKMKQFKYELRTAKSIAKHKKEKLKLNELYFFVGRQVR